MFAGTLGIRVSAGRDSNTRGAPVIQDAIEEGWKVGFFM